MTDPTSFKDTRLWLALKGSTPEILSCLDQLNTLSELSVEERMPFLARLLPLTRHENARIRKAAFQALSGVAGYTGLQTLLTGCSDAEPETRQEALLGFHESCQHDPNQWILALFHPDADMRLLALGQRIPRGTEDLLLAILLLSADPASQIRVEKHLKNHNIPVVHLHLLLRLHNSGHVSTETAKALITSLNWTYLFEIIDLRHTDLTDIPDYAYSAEEPPEHTPPPLSVNTAPLAYLISLFWENPAEETEQDQEEEPSPPEDFWKKLHRCPSIFDGARYDLIKAIHAVAAHKKFWIQPAADTLTMISIHALADERIPPELRRKSSLTIIKQAGNIEKDSLKTIKKILRNKICLDDSGRPNLTVIISVLLRLERAASGRPPDPYRILLNLFGLEPIVDAAVRQPRLAGYLLILPASQKSWSRRLIYRRIKDHPQIPGALLYCAVIAGTLPSQLGFLAELDPDILFNICEEIFTQEVRQEILLSRRKLQKTAEIIANKMTAEQVIPIVRLWFDVHLQKESYFGQELLADLAREISTDAFLKETKSASREDLIKLLTLIPCCPGFPVGKENALAMELKHHPDPSVERWCAERVLKTDKNAREDTEVDPSALLSDQEKNKIVSAGDLELNDLLQPALRHQRQGLCRTLLARPAPYRESVEVCAAALKSLDPLEEIDAVFHRYGNSTPSFLEKLDLLMVGNSRLPESLFGNCFLCLWEEHCFAAAGQIESLPGGFTVFIEIGDNLRSAPIRDVMWLTLKYLVSMWRFRDLDKLKSIFTPDFAHKMVDHLTEGNEPAAKILIRAFESGLLPSPSMTNVSPRVRSEIQDYPPNIRKILMPWIDSTGITGNSLRLTGKKDEPSKEITQKITGSMDTQFLLGCCLHANGGVVNEAVLRIIELETPLTGLAQLMIRDPAPDSIGILTESISLWPEGEALSILENAIPLATTPLVSRFKITLAMLERGCRQYEKLIFEILNTETDSFWFQKKDWERLLKLGLDKSTLVETCVISPQPVMYQEAVQILKFSIRIPPDRRIKALRSFLDLGRNRKHTVRLEAALTLGLLGCPDGWPIILTALLAGEIEGEKTIAFILDLPGLHEEMIESALIAGAHFFPSRLLTGFLKKCSAPLLKTIIRTTRDPELRQAAINHMIKDDRHNPTILHLSNICKEGMQTGFALTGKRFQVKMLETGEIGYTRLEGNVIYATPIPVISQAPEGSRIVRGVILHEIGHHLFHAGKESREAHEAAVNEKITDLLNIVEDEHLERNLRVRNETWGDDFKKLAAYAFQHADREADAGDLLRALEIDAFPVLTGTVIKVGVKEGCVSFNAGGIWQKLEENQNSFSRFMRALRMGLGNRYNDPKVAAGLNLFKRGFKKASPERLLEIARELKKIFGPRAALLENLSWEGLSEDAETLLIGSDGITQENIDRALARTEKNDSLSGKKVIIYNQSKDTYFEKITRIVRLPFDLKAHQEYAQKTMRASRQLRPFFRNLGVRYLKERFRLSGRRLDRSRLQKMVIYGEPRLMIARIIKPVTDLFLSIIIDCSESMNHHKNIEKAKQFGTLLAESTVGVDGLDVRIFGFTDRVIYDAGTPFRCAVSALEAENGNNDAAVLWHAARIASASRRAVKLLVMISDGAPTACSTTALRLLVQSLARQQICCAQIALRKLDPEDICFPWYIVLDEDDLASSVSKFGAIMIKLVKQAMGG